MTPIVQRAFELATSGEHATITSVQTALAAEGYSTGAIRSHLEGLVIRRDLRAAIEKAAPGTPPG